MKTSKSKPQKKAAKSAAKKQIEQSLSDKFIEVVKSLGHDAESIAGDIAKVSKVVAKKLAKKFGEVKSVVEDKIESVTGNEDIKSSKKKLAKVPAKIKKADKSVSKLLKTASTNPKPVANSVKVEPLALTEPSSSASPTVKNAQPKSKTMNTKATKDTSSEKKSVVKAVTNNPVKKVSAKAIPSKKESDTPAKK